MMDGVSAWREAVAAIAKRAVEAVESVDPPLDGDAIEGLCVPDCGGLMDPRCKCRQNVAEPGW